MADPSGAVTPEWVYWIGGIMGTAAAALIAKLGLRDGSQEKAGNNTVGAIAALQPTADRLTTDALVQTLGALKVAVDRLADRLEEQDRDREEEERAELRELRRIVKDIRARE